MTPADPGPAALPPLPDPGTVRATRLAWHAVAEHVLAPARFAAEHRIGLAVTPGGFGIPADASGPSARVDGATLVVGPSGGASTVALRTVTDAARALGIEPGAPTAVFTPSTPLEPDAPLAIDPDAAAALAAWFDLGWRVLEDLRRHVTPAEAASPPTLWPEHFDAAIELGDESRGARGTFGVSPGDAQHPEPYLYVTHWSEVAPDPFWNDRAFPGASLAWSDVAGQPDAVAAMREFFAAGRRALAG